jgi:uncharacterized metal-binding protein YceD (DUF177 family)
MSADIFPISHPVRVEDISPSGLDVRLAPSESERAALAKFLEIPAIPVLGAHFKLMRKSHRVNVDGEIVGEVIRTCVVSLDDFSMPIKEIISLVFDEKADPDAELSEEDADAPEPLINGVIDLGGILTEFVALGLDPYPKKPGAVFSFHDKGDVEVNPFAALSALKSKE